MDIKEDLMKKKQIIDLINDTVNEKVYNYVCNGVITAKNVNAITNHFDSKLNIILKSLEGLTRKGDL